LARHFATLVTLRQGSRVLETNELRGHGASRLPGTHAEAVDVMVRILGDAAIIHSGYRDTRLTGESPIDAIRTFTSGGMAAGICVAAHFMRFPSPPKPEQ